jgi:hypothetical protein
MHQAGGKVRGLYILPLIEFFLILKNKKTLLISKGFKNK